MSPGKLLKCTIIIKSEKNLKNTLIRANSKRESTCSTKGNPDKYPWLAEDDPRRHQTDAEILHEKIDLKESTLSKKEKANLMKMI